MGIRTVSYTHLDVYKRQRLDCCTGGLYLKDIATKQLNVIWIENGAVVTGCLLYTSRCV